MLNFPIHSYAIGQLVECTVERMLPYGVFVRLQDGTRAYIRRRELSLEGDVLPGEIVSEGQEIKGVVHQLAGPGQLMELSLRATQPDPWQEFCREFHEGDVVTATVKDTLPSGVFAKIVPGVDGFIPLKELTSWKVERLEEVVWVGDHVEAVITHLDMLGKRVRLSIRQRLEQLARWEKITEHGRFHQKAEKPVEGTLEKKLTALWLDESSEIRSAGPVLVVEDDSVIKDDLVKWLSDQGCQAQGVTTVVQALERCRNEHYSLVLADLDLPEINGLSLIQQIRTTDDTMPVAVMSSPELIEKHLPTLQTLKVAEVFPKPLDLDDILHFLLRLARGEKPALQVESDRQAVPAEVEPFQKLAGVMRSSQPLAERFRQGLEYLIRETRAEVGGVFYLDPVSWQVSIIAQAGEAILNKEKVYGLVESPVKDVILEEDSIWESRVSAERTSRFRKLLDFLTFESCIGVPIEAGGQVEYALFLFHREPEAFSRYRLRDAWAMAGLFSIALESQALTERVQSLSRLFLSGHLAAGFGHEVFNYLTGFDTQFRNIRSDFEKLGRAVSGLNERFDFQEIRRALDKAVDTAMDLKRTVWEFQRLARTSEEKAVEVDLVIRQAEALVRPEARRENVAIRLELTSDLPPVAGNDIRLQQVFLNLMLNAVQMMENKPDDRRVLQVITAYEVQNGNRLVKVRFADTGPGIHRKLWDKIFALGFTTRRGGSGLGLFIARGLVESMGGRIIVEKSLIPLGTTFLVELPATRG